MLTDGVFCKKCFLDNFFLTTTFVFSYFLQSNVIKRNMLLMWLKTLAFERAPLKSLYFQSF